MENNNWKKNDICYFYDTNKKEIIKGKFVEYSMSNEVNFAILESLNAFELFGKKLNELFKTKEECRKYIDNKNKEQIIKYCNSIKTVDDLFVFMYNNDLNNTQGVDYQVKSAAEIMAKKLLNLDIKSKL